MNKNLILILYFFFLLNCNGNQPEKTGNGLIIKNVDIDASGTYIVSGTYSSSSTGGRLLQTMEVETTENSDEIMVQLYPVYKSIGKDPIGSRVFAFQGQMPVENYFSKTLTVKIFNTIKTLEKTN